MYSSMKVFKFIMSSCGYVASGGGAVCGWGLRLKMGAGGGGGVWRPAWMEMPKTRTSSAQSDFYFNMSLYKNDHGLDTSWQYAVNGSSSGERKCAQLINENQPIIFGYFFLMELLEETFFS